MNTEIGKQIRHQGVIVDTRPVIDSTFPKCWLPATAARARLHPFNLGTPQPFTAIEIQEGSGLCAELLDG
ncbi:hypothetical protein GCM10010470_45580 [Saccharopolyspora taberi]|uniref:Uncharacterized protein n=1 Tax=Saccharopolyspora taberi TaxID=60895 RepID=A0ABN3VHB9_9PSEU